MFKGIKRFCIYLLGFLYPVFLILLTTLFIFLIVGYALDSERITSSMTKIVIFLGGFLVFMITNLIKGLFYKFDEPVGHKIDEQSAPQLFSLLYQIKREIHGAKIHQVIIDNQLNAYIEEVPRLGVFFGYRRTLVIGLPLLLALNEKDLGAVLAHEYAHFSKKHGKWRARIFRSYRMWKKIYDDYKKTEKKNFLISKFSYWYLPKINDILFFTQKRDEFEADALAARISGNQTVADSLIKLRIYDVKLQRFYSEISKIADQSSEPVQNYFSLMEASFRAPLSIDLINAILESIREHKTLPFHTHPSTSERIAAIKASIRVPDETGLPAYSTLIGTADMLNILNGMYVKNITESWHQRYQKLQEDINIRHTLDKSLEGGSLDSKDTLTRGLLIERYEGTSEALSAFEEGMKTYPDYLPLKYHYNRLLLNTDRELAEEALTNIMNEDAQLIPHVCLELMNHHLHHQNREKALEYYYYAIRFMETNEEAKKERSTLSGNLIPHDLSDTTLSNLIESCKKYRQIKKVYVAILDLKLTQDFPLYAIGISYKCSRKKAVRIQQALMDQNPIRWEVFYFPINRNRAWELKLMALPNSRIL